jgi:DNA-binding PadR family transcriptional regulator
MYELFLLGKLMERPWYGYEYQKALNGFLGPSREVSWGTIYPLIRRLERAGFIHRFHERRRATGRRQPQKYAITAKGRARFLELMNSGAPAGVDFRDVFRAKVGNFSRVEAKLREQIIAGHMDQLTKIVSHTNAMAKVVAEIPEMPEPVRRDVLAALSHERFLAEAEIGWLRKGHDALVGSELNG